MEKYWDGLQDLEKTQLSSSHILDPRTREQLKMNYSSPMTLSVPSHLERPPSPVDAIERGCDFLTRECQKGFMPKFDAENYKKTLLRPAILAKANYKMMQKTTQNFDLNKLYETEKYQKFWLTTDTVTKIKKEISKLPFISSSDIQAVISRFLEYIASVVRTMKHRNMLENEDKQNKKQLRATMIHFISEAKGARKKAFIYAFQQEFLDLDKLDDSYKEEFQDDIPKYSRDKNRNDSENLNNLDCFIDEKMIEQYSLNCEGMPDAYKMKNYQMNEDQRSKTRKDFKKYINSLPQQLLDGINQIELQKAKSEPILNPKASNYDKVYNSNEDIQDNINDINQHDNIDSKDFSKSNSVHLKYGLNNNELDDDIFNSGDVKNIKHPPTIITIPFERKKVTSTDNPPLISDPEITTHQEVHNDYWNSFDPLDGTRNGDKEFQSISQIRQISSTFQGKYDNCKALDDTLPFKLEYDEIMAAKDQKVSTEQSSRKNNKKERKKKNIKKNESEKAKGPNLIGDIWTTSDLLNHVGNYINSDNEEFEEEEDNYDDFTEINPSNNQIFNHQMTLEAEKRNNDAMAFLKSFNFNKGSKKSNLIVSKLQEIWENLGFSVQQKISLLVKYTSSAEESQKLNEALNFWEMTFDIVSRYNNSYHELKDFINFEAPTSKHVRATCEMFKQQIEICEENVKQIADNLLQTFGDELIINKKKIQQIIPQRHKKMVEMISPYCGG